MFRAMTNLSYSSIRWVWEETERQADRQGTTGKKFECKISTLVRACVCLCICLPVCLWVGGGAGYLCVPLCLCMYAGMKWRGKGGGGGKEIGEWLTARVSSSSFQSVRFITLPHVVCVFPISPLSCTVARGKA